MRNKQAKPNTTLLGWCCSLLIRNWWQTRLLKWYLLIFSWCAVACCSGRTPCATQHHTAAWFLPRTAETVPALQPFVQASTGWFLPWCTKVLFSFPILSSARTWQCLVGTALVLCRCRCPPSSCGRISFLSARHCKGHRFPSYYLVL